MVNDCQSNKVLLKKRYKGGLKFSKMDNDWFIISLRLINSIQEFNHRSWIINRLFHKRK